MRKQLIILVVALTAATRISAQVGDTVAMPYLADFTQGWTATGGAVIVDSNHAVLSGEGQQLVSPWITVAEDDYQGFYLWASLQREGNEDPSDMVHYYLDYGDGYVEDYSWWMVDIDSGWYNGQIWPPMGQMRVIVAYEGCNGSQLHVSDFALFRYPIQIDMEAEDYTVSVGDTVRVRVHATLPDGSAPDSVAWEVWQNEAHPIGYFPYTIIEENDSMLTMVMDAGTIVNIFCFIHKMNVVGSYYASAVNNLLVTCFDRPFYEEDSICYTSTAKDTVIGSHYRLREAVLPEGVKAVMEYSFVDRYNLWSVQMPQSLEYIGKEAFRGTGLFSVTIPENVTYIGDFAFNGTFPYLVRFNARNCTYMGSSVSTSAFYWSSLSRIVIGEEVRRIPDYAFTYCYVLGDSLVIPDHVEYIGEYAFLSDAGNYGTPLSLVVGSSVNHIGDQAFYRPDHFASITMRNPSAPTVSGAPFPVLNCPLVVPCGARSTYMAAPYWGEWGEIVEDCNAIDDMQRYADVSVSVQRGRIVVTAADALPEVSVYSADGRLFARGNRGVYHVPASGVYFVKVGNMPARRVVVLK